MATPDWATCPSLADLESFLLDSAEESIRVHVQRCSSCRDQMERIRRNNEFFAVLAPKVQEIPLLRTKPESPAALVELVPGYTIRSQIHSGGQGVVYKAVQTATKRKVALKVLAHRSSISERQQLRFEREAEIVAGLHHPSIVTIFDSGTTEDARKYFAMELIAGVTLDIYLMQARPSKREIVRLAAKIARAIQFAHLRGVTHRDIKPGNILVDAGGEPHIIDFGLAKLAKGTMPDGQDLSVTGEFVGTLKYASPEQVSGDPDQIDARTDVYSLGVVLYEALTGQPPYIVTGSISDIARIISETEPKPPSRLGKNIDDDLETVVLKALSKDRQRRYQSAGEFADDLERYLDNLAISAKRDSLGYILRKAAGRYKVPTAVAVGYVALISISFVLAVLLWKEANQERSIALAAQQVEELQRRIAENDRDLAHAQLTEQRANEERRRAEVYAGFLNEMFWGVTAEVARGRDTTLLKEVLDRAAERASAKLADFPDVEAQVRTTVGSVYRKLNDWDAALLHLEAALAKYKSIPDPPPDGLSETLYYLGMAKMQTGGLDEALAHFQESIDVGKRVWREDDPELAARLNQSGVLQCRLQQFTSADASHREALRIYERAFGPKDPNYYRVGVTKGNLGLVYAGKREYGLAAQWYREAVAILVMADKPIETARFRNNLAQSLLKDGKVVEAEQECRAALDSRRKLHSGNHMDLVGSLENLGDILMAKKQVDGAEKAFAEGLQMVEALHSADDPITVRIREKLSGIRIGPPSQP